jgi:hypothetical protein
MKKCMMTWKTSKWRAQPTQTNSLVSSARTDKLDDMFKFVCPSMTIGIGGRQTDDFAGEFNDGQTNWMTSNSVRRGIIVRYHMYLGSEERMWMNRSGSHCSPPNQ